MLTLKPAWLTHTCSWIGFHSPAWRVTFMTPDLTKDIVCFLLCFCFWVFKGIICASSSHFCTQMHSIFYITWYCNKLHLQKRLWLLWMSSCATLWNCRLLRVRGEWQPLLLIWQENFIQMCSLLLLRNHRAPTLRASQTKMCVSLCMHVFVQEKEGMHGVLW